MPKLIDVSLAQTGSMPVTAGTLVTAPAGSAGGPATVDQLPLEILIGKTRVVEVGPGTVGRADLERADLRDDIRVLIRARAEKRKRGPLSGAALSADAATYLVQAGIKLVGFDVAAGRNGGDRGDSRQVLLGAGVILVEGLDLAEVAPGDYDMTCLPLRLAGSGAPARVVLRARPSSGA